MKKVFTMAALFVFMLQSANAQKLSKEDAKKAKEENKQIKDELKNYMKHPETYKAKMDAMKADKDTADAQLSRAKYDLQAAQANADDLQKRVTMNDEQAKNLQDEIDKLKESSAKEKSSQPNMESTPPNGTVYKIQLGMYKGLNLNKYFDQPRYIGYEEVDGMNRYVISYFPDEETALKFVADIRKLGVRDAFVAKYIDGTRVYEWSENPKYKGKKVPDSLEDALQSNTPKKGRQPKTQDQ